MGTPKDRVAAAKAAQPEVTVEVRTHAEAMVAARALADYLQRDPCYSDELLALVRLVGVLVEDGGEFTATLRALIATHDEYVALMARGDRAPADYERMDQLDEEWRDHLLSLAHILGHTKYDVTRALETLGRRDVAKAISDEIR